MECVVNSKKWSGIWITPKIAADNKFPAFQAFRGNVEGIFFVFAHDLWGKIWPKLIVQFGQEGVPLHPSLIAVVNGSLAPAIKQLEIRH